MAVRMQYETWVAGRKLYHLVLTRDFHSDNSCMLQNGVIEVAAFGIAVVPDV